MLYKNLFVKFTYRNFLVKSCVERANRDDLVQKYIQNILIELCTKRL